MGGESGLGKAFELLDELLGGERVPELLGELWEGGRAGKLLVSLLEGRDREGGRNQDGVGRNRNDVGCSSCLGHCRRGRGR